MSLPENVGFCTITGKYISAVMDGTEADRDPDGVPMVGLTLTFTPSLRPPIIKDATTTPPVSIRVHPVVAHTDADGVLVGSDGVPGIRLVASDYPDPANPWVWTVTITGQGFPGGPFQMVAPSGGTIDLTSVLEAPSGAGFDTSAWAALVAQATTARDEATTASVAAESARAAAVVAQQAAEAVPAQVDAAMASVAADPSSDFAILQSTTIADAQAAPAALNPWLSAVANREHAPAHAVFWGTSMTEGGGMISTSRLDRWIDRLDFGLRSKFPLRTPVAGSIGYIPAFYDTFPAGGTSQFGIIVPPGVTINRALAKAGYGFGTHALELSQAGDFWQAIFSGSTGFDLFFNTRDVAGSGATIAIDGGAPSALAVPAGTSTEGPTYQARGLSAGSHTVRVAWTAGHVDVQGLYPYNGDESSGIHVWDAGKGSSKAGDFQPGAFYQHVYLQPALIGIEYGYNEYFGGIPVATFAANLATFVTRALANLTKPPTVLFIVWPRGGTSTTTYPVPYQQYVDAIYAQAAATPNGIVLDFSKRLPAPVVDNALGFFGGDTTHPSNRGGVYFADTILAAISPR